ncbi:hypothetical protein DWUX_2484 [Desulfovibrio diazotrophicus]|nr:hypothetical protein DWUX_2484 [Desulfovibrio diazotrophicus]
MPPLPSKNFFWGAAGSACAPLTRVVFVAALTSTAIVFPAVLFWSIFGFGSQDAVRKFCAGGRLAEAGACRHQAWLYLPCGHSRLTK